MSGDLSAFRTNVHVQVILMIGEEMAFLNEGTRDLSEKVKRDINQVLFDRFSFCNRWVMVSFNQYSTVLLEQQRLWHQ